MINPNSQSNLSLVECQTLCKYTVGCHYFTYKIGSDFPCFMKLASGVKEWKKVTSYPVKMAYSGYAGCGKKYLIRNCNFLLNHLSVLYRLIYYL